MPDPIDADVAEARQLATQLNTVLDRLEDTGIACLSVVGALPSWGTDPGNARDLMRIALVLHFKIQRKDD